MTDEDVQRIKDGIAHTIWLQERLIYLIEESVIDGKRFGPGAFDETHIRGAMAWTEENASDEAKDS